MKSPKPKSIIQQKAHKQRKAFEQHPAITRRQVKSIRKIQARLRRYKIEPNYQLRLDDIQKDLWNLQCIITITDNRSVTLKAIQLEKVLKKIKIYKLKQIVKQNEQHFSKPMDRKKFCA